MTTKAPSSIVLTELLQAGEDYNIEVLRAYYSTNPSNSVVDKNGNTLLHLFILNKLEDASIWVVQNCSPDLMVTNNEKQTALHIATKNNLLNLIALLASRLGSDARDSLGRNALSIAILIGNYEAVKVLLERNLSIVDPDIYGFSPLVYSFLHGKKDLARLVVSSMHQSSPIIKITEIPKQFPLFAIPYSLPYECTILHLSIIISSFDLFTLALSITSNIEAVDSLGNTALGLASELGRTDICFCLSSLGARCELFDAIKDDDFETFSSVLDSQSCCVDPEGRTPLHMAAALDRVSMVEVMAPLYPQVPDYLGRFPMTVATPSTLSILANYGTSIPPFDPSVFRGTRKHQ